ncbi:MAG: transporter [Parvularculaceae bacterium]
MKHLIALCSLILFLATPAHAQFDGPRTYWPMPKNYNIVAAHYINGTANASWSVWNQVQANVDIDSDLFLLSYTRNQAFFGRAVYWQLIVPAGTLKTDSPLPLSTNDDFVKGLGDPAFGATINLVGVPEMRAKDFLRHELDFSANIGAMIYFPLGQYDEDEPLNMGSNQWRVRLSAPMLKSIGSWVPGKRTTLEVVPSVMIFGDNDNSLGARIEQKPTVAIEAHLTRDLTRKVYVSLDYTWISGGEQTYRDIDTSTVVRETDGLGAQALGATINWEINDGMHLYLTHMQTLSSSADPFDLEGSLTKVTLAYSWHDVLERVKKFTE